MRNHQLALKNILGVLGLLSTMVWTAPAEYAWESPTNKIVVLAVNAHPDDEGIFFGGSLPYYSSVLQLPTVILSMTSGDANPYNLEKRENELRDAAWTYGVRYEPLFPRFRDVYFTSSNPNPYANTIDATWDYWADGILQGDGSDVEAGKLKAINYVAEQIRRYRPEVIITHDLNGEYGHDNHKATAIVVTNAFFVAADAGATATNLVGLAPWQSKKLYLHLYGSNKLFHSFFELPFAALSNQTCRQVGDAGVDAHVSQGPPDVSSAYRSDENYDEYDSEWWGLYASTVGPDPVLTNDVVVSGYTVPAGSSAGNFLANLAITNEVNDPPAFMSDPLELPLALAGESYSGQSLMQWVTDPDFAWDEESLMFEVNSGPAWLMVSSNGVLSGYPSASDIGTNLFEVTVTDSGGLQDQTTVALKVVHGIPQVADLVGWWKFDETNGWIVADSAYPANNGSVVGAPAMNQSGATTATATSMRFEGTTSAVSVAYAPELNTTNFTAMLWGKVISGEGAVRTLLSNRSRENDTGYVFYAYSDDAWRFYIGSGSSWVILHGGPLITNKWIHLAASYDGTTARFYTNGVLADSSSVSFMENSLYPMSIGSRGGSTGKDWFPGFVDDVRIYRTALTANQIAGVYSNQPPEFQQNPISIPSTFAGTLLSEQGPGESAVDPEDALLGFGVLSGPAWLGIDNSGTLGGIPLTTNEGSNSFTIGVFDQQGAMDSAIVNLEVLPGRSPRFTNIVFNLSGQVELTSTGAVGQTYIIQTATNLPENLWEPIATNSIGTNWFDVYDPFDLENQQRFYRAVIP